MESKKKQSRKRSRYQQKPARKNKLLAYGFSKDLAQDVPEEVKRLDKLKHSWIPFGDDNWSIDFVKFNNKQSYINIPLKGFGVNLAAGEWLQDITDTHPYSFKNRALFGIEDTMRAACYYYRQGQTFVGMNGIISGTVGGRVDITVYDIRITCDAQHVNNNYPIGTTTITLGGIKVANCFTIGPASSAFGGEGMIVVSVSHTGKDNISFNLQSKLLIQ